MALNITTNMASMATRRYLAADSSALQGIYERLSSGLRVNRTSDDVAGMGVSERLSIYIRGDRMAVRNVNDGISMMQTAETAMGQIANSLQRVRELAVQALNGTYDDTQRVNINYEVEQLKEEITRVLTTTRFNGQYLLNQGTMFQPSGIGSALTANTVDSGGVAGTAFVSAFFTSAGANQGQGYGYVKAGDKLSIQAGSQDYEMINLDTAIDGVNSANMYNWMFFAGGAYFGTGATAVTAGAQTGYRTVMDATGGTAIHTAASGFSLSLFNLTTTARAAYTLDIVDDHIDQVVRARAQFGAWQLRFEKTSERLVAFADDLDASKGRIMDADYGYETSQLTRYNVLQQAATSMLSQANAAPSLALSLLK